MMIRSIASDRSDLFYEDEMEIIGLAEDSTGYKKGPLLMGHAETEETCNSNRYHQFVVDHEKDWLSLAPYVIQHWY